MAEHGGSGEDVAGSDEVVARSEHRTEPKIRSSSVIL